MTKIEKRGFYFKFWSSLPRDRLSLSAFSQVHRFQSYSFGQVNNPHLGAIEFDNKSLFKSKPMNGLIN